MVTMREYGIQSQWHFLQLETLIITSEGLAAERFPSQMGVYRMTNLSHSGRPVWLGRNGSILFNGKNFKWVQWPQIKKKTDPHQNSNDFDFYQMN